MLTTRRTTIDAAGTRAKLDGLQAAVRREAEGAEADPFDDAMVAAVLGAAEALKAEGGALAELEGRFGKLAQKVWGRRPRRLPLAGAGPIVPSVTEANMATSGAERQAEYEGRKRNKLADALAEVERLQARVAVLERECDRLDGLVGFALKREEWAAAERLRASEAERESEADNETDLTASEIVVVRAPSPSRAPSVSGATYAAIYARTAFPVPSWLMPTSC